MIDTHTHVDTRSSEDFEKMYLAGIDTIITCSFYPYKLANETVLLNHLERILHYDTKRVGKYGIDLKVALGIHPSNTTINPKLIYDNLYKWIENKDIIAIGEIGLEDLTENEYKLFEEQLDIAQETKTKVIVHTPRKNKEKVLKEIMNVLENHIDPNLVVIDHVNKNIIGELINTDYTLGLTVQPQKLTPQDAIDILDEYGFDRFLLDSDMSNNPSNPLSVPKTVRELERLGFENKEIKKVAFKNAEKFYKI